jgi:membrane protein
MAEHDQHEPEDDGRGRSAERPRDIPGRGWRDVAVRVKREVKEDDVSIVAGGVAYYGFLSIFPALAALVSIFGLVADPAEMSRQFEAIGGLLPQQVRSALHGQLNQLTSHSSSSLSAGVAISILLALWSANKGTKALIQSLNIAFDQEEERGFFKLNALSLLLTIGAIAGVLLSVGLVVAVPILLGHLGLSNAGEFLVRWLRWPFLAAFVLVAFAVVYRYAPSRATAKWRWVTPGSLVALVIWLGGSALFSVYVSNFGKYDKVYGSVGVIVILLTWFLLSAYAVILGAEVNAELERQTAKDSTTGGPHPLGRRGAFAADTVAQTP